MSKALSTRFAKGAMFFIRICQQPIICLTSHMFDQYWDRCWADGLCVQEKKCTLGKACTDSLRITSQNQNHSSMWKISKLATENVLVFWTNFFLTGAQEHNVTRKPLDLNMLLGKQEISNVSDFIKLLAIKSYATCYLRGKARSYGHKPLLIFKDFG